MRRLMYAHRARFHEDQSGISLIEMLAAVTILAIVMSAFAASLINMLQATTRNEQDLRATAIAQQISEELQVANWDNAVLYEEEVAAASVRWKARTTVGGSGETLFEGLEVITQPRPTVFRDPATAGPADVPTPSATRQAGNTAYNIDRYLVWSTRVNTNDTRRFVVIVSWDDQFGTYREVRYEAERVPTPEEAAPTSDGLKVLFFSVNPDKSNLDPSAGTPVDTVGDPQDLVVTLRTNKPLASAALTYEYLVETDNTPDPPTYSVATHTVPMDHVGNTDTSYHPDYPTNPATYVGWTSWTYTVESPVGAAGDPNVFYNGLSEFTVVGDNACTPCDDVLGAELVEFVGGPQDDPGEPSPTGSPTVDPSLPPLTINSMSPGTMCVTSNKGELNANRTFSLDIDGLDAVNPAADGAVTITYFRRTDFKQNDPSAGSDATTVATASYDVVTDTWKITIPTGTGFWHWGYNGGKYDFIAKVVRASDGLSDEQTYIVSVTQC